MFGFTISKINLLILVLAMFVIVTYFMFGWSNVLVSFSAQQIVDKRIGSDIYNKLGSESICDTSPINSIPPYIDYFADVSMGGRYFYTVSISKLNNSETGKNILIIKAASRKEPDRVLAVSSFRTDADIRIFDWVESDLTTDQCYFEDKESLLLDPQADLWREQIPKDAITILMEHYEGKKTLYIIACSTKDGIEGGFCEDNLGLVGCMLKKERAGFEGNCFPIDSCCEDADMSTWSCGCGIGG